MLCYKDVGKSNMGCMSKWGSCVRWAILTEKPGAGMASGFFVGDMDVCYKFEKYFSSASSTTSTNFRPLAFTLLYRSGRILSDIGTFVPDGWIGGAPAPFGLVCVFFLIICSIKCPPVFQGGVVVILQTFRA